MHVSLSAMSKIFGIGSNGNGQLGIGHLEDVNKPTECIGVPSNFTVTKITGGGNHSALITTAGQLFMAGFSQRGENHMKKLLSLTKVEQKAWTKFTQRFQDIIWRDVACGWAFTLILADSGKVYGIGTSKWNELNGPCSEELVQLDHHQLQDIVAVACGWRHAMALDKQGRVYGWGCGRHGQLGPSKTPPKDKKDIRPVEQIQLPQPIVQIACGHLHTLLRGKDGTVYAFGSNKYGQLGDMKEENIVNDSSIDIGAGWHHSASLSKDGQLNLWGRNDHGQLSNQKLMNVATFSCGSEHTLAIDTSDRLVAWGWNEHGNCTTDKPFVDDPVPISSTHKAYKVGAGCATSWFACK